jgi:hypothetical protein
MCHVLSMLTFIGLQGYMTMRMRKSVTTSSSGCETMETRARRFRLRGHAGGHNRDQVHSRRGRGRRRRGATAAVLVVTGRREGGRSFVTMTERGGREMIRLGGELEWHVGPTIYRGFNLQSLLDHPLELWSLLFLQRAKTPNLIKKIKRLLELFLWNWFIIEH